MKKTNRYLIPIFILIVGLSVFMERQAQQSSVEKEKINTAETDFLGEPIEKKTEPVLVKAAATKPAQEVKEQSFEKCASFLKVEPSAEATQLAAMLSQIKKHYAITNEVVDLTEYQLHTRSNEELVVQHIPTEEPKNQVRVFKTAADGFPDRIKDFPNSGGTEELRLEGALTLGSISKKIEKFKIVNHDRSVLAYEKSNDEITRIDFTSGRNQLVCEDQQCSCHEF